MIKKQIFHYLVATFLVTVAYTLPHSILTVLLLDKGLSISQILIIQSAYSLAIILFEFPSGMLADNWSRKYLYLTSRLLLIMMFLIILISSNFYFLYLAWFIYGIAAAFESGTLDSYLITKLKRSSNDKLIEVFIAKDKQYPNFPSNRVFSLASDLKIRSSTGLVNSLLNGVALMKI